MVSETRNGTRLEKLAEKENGEKGSKERNPSEFAFLDLAEM